MAIDVRGMAPLLQIFDMPTSIGFYCGVIGFEIVKTDGKTPPRFDWVLLRLNGSELMLNTAYEAKERPPTPDPVRVAAHRDVAIYFGCPDVDAAYAHLTGAGVSLAAPTIAWYGMKQLRLVDPDGYHLCFHWQAAKTSSQAS